MSRRPPLVLGTAQLTNRYGVTDERSVEPQESDALAVLAVAGTLGIGAVDTAPAYGAAEAAIGRSPESFAVHTKVSAGRLPSESLARSRRVLGEHRVEILYLHDPDEVCRSGGAGMADARALAETGEVTVGASVYDLTQFEAALADPAIAAVQVPLNALDRRFAGAAMERAVRSGTRVVARSVLLQGVLAGTPERLPRSVSHLTGPATAFAAVARRHDLSSIELALGWVRGHDQLHGIVVGTGSTRELAEIVAAADRRIPSEALDDLDALDLPDPAACDPRNWSRA